MKKLLALLVSLAIPAVTWASSSGTEPAVWSVIPFITLLVMIATGPLFYAHFWHKNYPLVAAALGALVVVYYLVVLGNATTPVHSLSEYVSFIALLAALFVASGGILIQIDRAGTPGVNVALLVIGSLIANIIGTTGASMLLIRPFIRLNKDRIRPYHIVFFIFMVSNVGGCLTPIGDPPLFLGFLKGIDFFWTVVHLGEFWIVGIALLAVMFYFIDKRNHTVVTTVHTGKMTIKGTGNLIFLAITIGAVFLDPNLQDWMPGVIQHDGHTYIGTLSTAEPGSHAFSFIREGIMFLTAFLAFKLASKEALRGNEFNFEPIKEVAFLFIGIFATMMPALELISSFASSDAGHDLINQHSLYWLTGALSGVLDNAPTYLNFLAAGMGTVSVDGVPLNIASGADVHAFSLEAVAKLSAISIGAVFFGAMTYIGNAPNFMVKSIAEQTGIQMPSFMGYVIRYSIPFLVPVLLLTWLIFFVIINVH
jgi:Na+/H+ antiporter NhaD/arsenite permease-like protein